MTQGAREHPDVTAAVKYYRALKFIKPSLAAVAKHFKIDRSTLSKALKRKNGK